MENLDQLLDDANYHDSMGNHARAAELYSEAYAAGSVVAAMGLARLYADGNGVPHDAAKAAQMLEFAIESGNATAAFNYAAMLHSGHHGLPQDRKRAQHYFRLARHLGFTDVDVSQWLDEPGA